MFDSNNQLNIFNLVLGTPNMIKMKGQKINPSLESAHILIAPVIWKKTVCVKVISSYDWHTSISKSKHLRNTDFFPEDLKLTAIRHLFFGLHAHTGVFQK